MSADLPENLPTPLFAEESLTTIWEMFVTWVETELLVPASALQTLVLIVGLALAYAAAASLRPALTRLSDLTNRHAQLRRSADALIQQTIFILWLFVVFWAVLIAGQMGWPDTLLTVAANLLAAWVVIQIASSFVRNRSAARVIATVAWAFAALNILGWLVPFSNALDSVAFSAGDFRLSLLTLGKAIFTLGILLWLALALSSLIERRLQSASDLSPAMQVLLGKVSKISLIIIASLAGLGAVGIDITTLAVFTGALGFGIGFGMQKVVSNLVSGLILLLDKSVKPGDVITVGETYGWVNSMGARYVSLVTRDGVEYLVPNEDLITQQVENWSYTTKFVRQEIEFGVSYNSDVHQTIALAMAAASEVPRVLSDPKPNCFIVGFGDSSVDFTLRFWLSDPKDGVSNLRGAVFLALWDALQAHEIEIPFPQRDLHLRTAEALPVVIERGEST